MTMRFLDLVASLGTAEIGRRYIACLIADLDAIRATSASRKQSETEETITMALWGGEDENGDLLDTDLLWQLQLAVLAACPDNDELLWCLGDGLFDNNALRTDATGRRLADRMRAERATNPDLQGLYAAMRRTLPQEGITTGSWFE